MKSVVVFRCLDGQLLTIRATNLNFLEFKASAGPKVLILLLYGYVEGHMALDDFMWTDPLSRTEARLCIAVPVIFILVYRSLDDNLLSLDRFD